MELVEIEGLQLDVFHGKLVYGCLQSVAQVCGWLDPKALLLQLLEDFFSMPKMDLLAFLVLQILNL